VKIFRTLPTGRLIALIAGVVVVAVGGASIAVAARGGGSTPPPKPLADAIHDALAATKPSGVTARITFSNKLFPSGALTGQAGSALVSGASGRLWLNDSGGRLELQSDAGDVQVVWNDTELTVYDASSNTVYRATLPEHKTASSDQSTVPSVAQISDFLTKLGERVVLSDAQPSDLAGQEAYTVRVSPKHDGGLVGPLPRNVTGQPAYKVVISPKHDGGLLGAAEIAFDASRGVPLRIGIYAQGASSPVLELAATDISYGSVSSSDVEVTPPAGAKVVDLGSLTRRSGSDHGDNAAVSGLSAVQAGAGFPVVAPVTLVGLPRQDLRLVGSGDSKAAFVVYGHGLGAIVVVERAADGSGSGALSSLPTVSLDGITAHELATQLGTALMWKRDGVRFLLAGSIPTAAAEAAARALG
jgi:outer membrane lipoprotein-sorting protein